MGCNARSSSEHSKVIAMTPLADLDNAVEELVAQSLRAWRVSGDVARGLDGELHVTAHDKHLRITRAPADLPFRWMIADAERTRGVTSVSGLLRNVRAAIDPGYRPVRLRIAPLPLDAP
jgi:hypothetical protein